MHHEHMHRELGSIVHASLGIMLCKMTCPVRSNNYRRSWEERQKQSWLDSVQQ